MEINTLQESITKRAKARLEQDWIKLENLELMTRTNHAAHHAKENNINRKRDKTGRYL